MENADVSAPANGPRNFIEEAVEADLASGKVKTVVTRFPPEPNAILHLGHAKAINIDFGTAARYGGRCHLRFDDTNPSKEKQEYVDAIQRDIAWLGYSWGEHLYFGSDYFDTMYEYAIIMIKAGKAYVDDLSPEQMREYRGTLTVPGRNSPYRDRTVEENLDLFERMRRGEFPNGSKVLRAKIDMASPNINLRDPVMYRIITDVPHHRQGDKWKIYPMYDWAHGFEDAIEGVTHSLCSLEYEDHRPLYNWFLEQVPVPCHPRQIEFARFSLTHTVMSKRKLLDLVAAGVVKGLDDPRLPTIAAMRRRGYTPEAIRAFCDRIGVAKRQSLVDLGMLEFCVREHLNKVAPRVMGVLKPLRVVIDNYPEGQVEELEAINNPEDPSAGTRKVPFSRVLYIEQDDFMLDPPKKFFRLAPGREVRLRYAYFVKCERAVTDPLTGAVTELHCTFDPATRGGNAPDGRQVKATIHWVSAGHAVEAEVRLYDVLFTRPDMDNLGENEDYRTFVNPNSLQVLSGVKVEPGLRTAKAGDRFQFERQGYFCVDPDSTSERLVFNRTVTLKDEWAKIQKGQAKQG